MNQLKQTFQFQSLSLSQQSSVDVFVDKNHCANEIRQGAGGSDEEPADDSLHRSFAQGACVCVCV